MSVFGDNGPCEGFCYASQTDNEFKLCKKWAGSDNDMKLVLAKP